MRVGPFSVSQSTHRRKRRPSPRRTQSQLAAQAQQRAAAQARLDAARAERLGRYGRFSVADPRTWHIGHSVAALMMLILLFALPSILGDGPIAGWIWAAAVLAGIGAWGVWLLRLHIAQAPARQLATDQRRRAEAVQAQAAAQARAAHLDYLKPRQVEKAWHHGACTTNHRTYDTAVRCNRGGS